jgi:hypothetical protein
MLSSLTLPISIENYTVAEGTVVNASPLSLLKGYMATLEQIIEKALTLSPADKEKLRQFLDLELEQVKARDRAQPTPGENGDDDTRARRLEWLKSHREEYGGQYVALDGAQLIAVGPNYPNAREKALAAGKPNAFVTYLPKPDEIGEMGGWV